MIQHCRKTSHSRTRKKIISYSDPETLWTKIENLPVTKATKKSFKLQKRSKKTHQRANHEDKKFKNHRKSISVS